MSDTGGAGAEGGAGGGAAGAGGSGGGSGGGAAADFLGGGAGGGTQGGSGGNDFLATLPEDIRGNPALQSYKDLPSLAKSVIEMRGMIGANTVKLPGADAKPEDLKPILAKLGLPEKPDGYKLPELKLPDGVRDEAMEKIALGKFHELGLLPQQVNGLLEWFYGTGVEGMKAQQAQAAGDAAKNIETLKQEYGEAAFEQRGAMVARLFNSQFLKGGEEVREKLRAAGLGTDPTIFRWLDQIGATMVEGRHVEGLADVGLMMTPEQAKAKIDAINNNKGHAYWKPEDPGYASAKAEMERLYTLANPEKK